MGSDNTYRRDILRAGAGISVVGLAGCLGDDDDTGNGDDSSGNGGGNGDDSSGNGDEFPTDSVRKIVPYGPGGSYDTISRALMPYVSQELGVPIPIVNMGGSRAFIGYNEVVTAAPDGYTMGSFGITNMAIRVLLGLGDDGLPYDEIKGINTLTVGEYVVCTTPELNVDSPGDLSDRFADNELGNIAVSAVGGTMELVFQSLKQNGHLDWDDLIEYNSAEALTQAVHTGEVPCGIMSSEGAIPPIENGTVDGIFVTSPEPSSTFPDFPTTVDAGWGHVPGGESDRIVFAPPDTPDDRINVIAESMEAAINSDEFQEWNEDTGNDIGYTGPEECQERIDRAFRIEDEVDLSPIEVE